MNQETSRNLVLTFKTEDQKEISLTIRKPADGLDGTEVKAAMDTIIATGAFGHASPAASIVGAKYDIRQTETIELV